MEDDGEDSDDDFLRAVARTPEIAPRSAPAPDSLTRLAQFRIEGKLGRGGMGIVYRAEDEKLRRTVALKVLPDDFADDEQKRKRFLREARVAGSINHPNVATVYEVGEIEGRIYIAMELAAGVTLRKLMEERRLDETEAVKIGVEIARGVSRAHARGIAHRDLKPDNVMVDEAGKVKVLDFGLARTVEISAAGEESATWTQEGRIAGTPGYMSPEQATGRTADVRTDVFALGVILYEMLAGRRPFVGETSMEVVIATSRDQPSPLSKSAPTVSHAVGAVVMRCLEKEASLRFASAEEVLLALEGAAGASGEAAPASDARTNEARPRGRMWLVAGVIAALGVAGWKRSALWSTPVAPSSSVVTAPSPPASSSASAGAPGDTLPTVAATTTTATPSTISRLDSPSVPPSPNGAASTRALPRPSASTTGTTPAPVASSSQPRGGVIETSPY